MLNTVKTILSFFCIFSFGFNINIAIGSDYKNLTIITNPVIEHKLSIARDIRTQPDMFRKMVNDITILMSFDITKNFKTEDITVTTPLTQTKGVKLAQKFVIVPILRAGQSMIEPFLTLLPNVSVGYAGIYRDKKTKQAVEYLFKIPEVNNQQFIVVDPMLAGGNTASYVINKLVKIGVNIENIVLVTLISAPEGVIKLEKEFPSLKIFTAALDTKLNEDSYIEPGLGDAGDRLYGTEHN